MVARMTLEQIARFLQIEPLEAKNALNRVGICSPAGGDDDAILVTSADLRRVVDNVELHRRGWAVAGAPTERSV